MLLTDNKYNCSKVPKFITVWENRRPYNFTQVLINPSKIRTWNQILQMVTEKLRPEFTVLQLMNLKNNKVVKCFDQLENNGQYVAVDHKSRPKICKSLKKRDLTFSQLQLAYSHLFQDPEGNKGLYQYRPCQDDIEKYDFLKKTKDHGKTIIFVYSNGCNKTPPKKLVFTAKDLHDWNRVKNFIADELNIVEGVESLYTVNGDQVCGYWELQHGSAYVAVGFRDTFKKKNYLAYCRQYLPGWSRYSVSETAISGPYSSSPDKIYLYDCIGDTKTWGKYCPFKQLKDDEKSTLNVLHKKKDMLDKKSYTKFEQNILYGEPEYREKGFVCNCDVDENCCYCRLKTKCEKLKPCKRRKSKFKRPCSKRCCCPENKNCRCKNKAKPKGKCPMFKYPKIKVDGEEPFCENMQAYLSRLTGSKSEPLKTSTGFKDCRLNFNCKPTVMPCCTTNKFPSCGNLNCFPESCSSCMKPPFSFPPNCCSFDSPCPSCRRSPCSSCCDSFFPPRCMFPPSKPQGCPSCPSGCPPPAPSNCPPCPTGCPPCPSCPSGCPPRPPGCSGCPPRPPGCPPCPSGCSSCPLGCKGCPSRFPCPSSSPCPPRCPRQCAANAPEPPCPPPPRCPSLPKQCCPGSQPCPQRCPSLSQQSSNSPSYQQNPPDCPPPYTGESGSFYFCEKTPNSAPECSCCTCKANEDNCGCKPKESLHCCICGCKCELLGSRSGLCCDCMERREQRFECKIPEPCNKETLTNAECVSKSIEANLRYESLARSLAQRTTLEKALLECRCSDENVPIEGYDCPCPCTSAERLEMWEQVQNYRLLHEGDDYCRCPDDVQIPSPLLRNTVGRLPSRLYTDDPRQSEAVRLATLREQSVRQSSMRPLRNTTTRHSEELDLRQSRLSRQRESQMMDPGAADGYAFEEGAEARASARPSARASARPSARASARPSGRSSGSPRLSPRMSSRPEEGPYAEGYNGPASVYQDELDVRASRSSKVSTARSKTSRVLSEPGVRRDGSQDSGATLDTLRLAEMNRERGSRPPSSSVRRRSSQQAEEGETYDITD